MANPLGWEHATEHSDHDILDLLGNDQNTALANADTAPIDMIDDALRTGWRNTLEFSEAATTSNDNGNGNGSHDSYTEAAKAMRLAANAAAAAAAASPHGNVGQAMMMAAAADLMLKGHSHGLGAAVRIFGGGNGLPGLVPTPQMGFGVFQTSTSASAETRVHAAAHAKVAAKSAATFSSATSLAHAAVIARKVATEAAAAAAAAARSRAFQSGAYSVPFQREGSAGAGAGAGDAQFVKPQFARVNMSQYVGNSASMLVKPEVEAEAAEDLMVKELLQTQVSAAKRQKREPKVCVEDDCPNKAYYKGQLCTKHGAAQPPAPPGPPYNGACTYTSELEPAQPNGPTRNIKVGGEWSKWVLECGAKERNAAIREFKLSDVDVKDLKKTSRRMKLLVAQRRYLAGLRKRSEAEVDGEQAKAEGRDLLNVGPPPPRNKRPLGSPHAPSSEDSS